MSLSVLCVITHLQNYALSKHRIREHGIFYRSIAKHCHILKCASFHVLQKHDGLASKPNNVCKLCNYTCSIKQVLAMHMHNEHNGAAPVQKSCNICLFTTHLSDVLKNHIERKHVYINKKHFNVISVIFLPRAKMCLSITNILSTEKKPA